jgi:hypothetical protein
MSLYINNAFTRTAHAFHLILFTEEHSKLSSNVGINV